MRAAATVDRPRNKNFCRREAVGGQGGMRRAVGIGAAEGHGGSESWVVLLLEGYSRLGDASGLDGTAGIGPCTVVGQPPRLWQLPHATREKSVSARKEQKKMLKTTTEKRETGTKDKIRCPTRRPREANDTRPKRII